MEKYYTLVIDRAEKTASVIEITGATCDAVILHEIEKARGAAVANIRLIPAGCDELANFEAILPKKYRKFARKVPQMVAGFSRITENGVVY